MSFLTYIIIFNCYIFRILGSAITCTLTYSKVIYNIKFTKLKNGSSFGTYNTAVEEGATRSVASLSGTGDYRYADSISCTGSYTSASLSDKGNTNGATATVAGVTSNINCNINYVIGYLVTFTASGGGLFSNNKTTSSSYAKAGSSVSAVTQCIVGANSMYDTYAKTMCSQATTSSMYICKGKTTSISCTGTYSNATTTTSTASFASNVLNLQPYTNTVTQVNGATNCSVTVTKCY